MRNINEFRNRNATARIGMKALPLAILIAGFAPFQAQAAGEEVCNTIVSVTGVEGPTPFFVGDELILRASIGADLIRDNDRTGLSGDDNPYIQFSGIGYGIDCGGGVNSDNAGCYPTGYPDENLKPWGHDIEFLGVTGSTCQTSGAGATNWPIPQADNIVGVPALNGPVYLEYSPLLGVGESCTVDMKFVVNELHESTNWVAQAVGVPFYDEPDTADDDMLAQCSNELYAAGYGNTVFKVHTCDISVLKEVSLDGENWAKAQSAFNGDDVFYRLVVTNTGSANLVGDVIVEDSMLSVVNHPVPSGGLAPKEQMIIDGGIIKNFDYEASCTEETTEVNTAGVTAWCRGNVETANSVFKFADDTAALTCTPPPVYNPDIEIVKDGKLDLGENNFADAGKDVIDYTFTVSNTGDVVLTNVLVTDDIVDPIACEDKDGNGLTNGAITLAVPETIYCSGSYTITADDIAFGERENTAKVVGDAPAGVTPPQVEDTDTHVEPIPSEGSISLLKQISLTGGDPWFDADEVANAPETLFPADAYYRFVVTNTGNRELTDVIIDDPTLGIFDHPVGTLTPGQIATITEITGTNGNLLVVVDRCTSHSTPLNTASVEASHGEGETAKDDDPAYLSCVGTPGIDIQKQISLTGDAPWEDVSLTAPYPDPAYYRIVVTNTGDEPLTNINVKDTDLPVTLDFDYVDGDGAPLTLAPKGSFVLVGKTGISGTIHRSELEVAMPCGDPPGPGPVDNTASVYAENYYDSSDVVTDSDPVELVCEGESSIELKKYVRTGTDTWEDANDLQTALVGQAPLNVEYKITIENTGEVDLKDLEVTDGERGVTENISALLAGDIFTLRGSCEAVDGTLCRNVAALEVTPLCVTSGQHVNTANVTALTNEAVPQTVNGADPAWVVCTGTPDIQLVKEVGVCEVLDGDLPDGGIACEVKNLANSPVPGVVTWYDDNSSEQEDPADAWYRFTVSNTGNEDLSDVTLYDPMLFEASGHYIGSLAYESDPVVIGVGQVPGLYVEGLCGTEAVTNTADVIGVGDSGIVQSTDWARLMCAYPPVEICVNGNKPKYITVAYDADSGSDYHPDMNPTISPLNAVFPATDVTIEVFDRKGADVTAFSGVSPGDELRISLHKINELQFMIYGDDPDTGTVEGDENLLQKVTFHVSCSQPLNGGDEFGAITLVRPN